MKLSFEDISDSGSFSGYPKLSWECCNSQCNGPDRHNTPETAPSRTGLCGFCLPLKSQQHILITKKSFKKDEKCMCHKLVKLFWGHFESAYSVRSQCFWQSLFHRGLWPVSSLSRRLTKLQLRKEHTRFGTTGTFDYLKSWKNLNIFSSDYASSTDPFAVFDREHLWCSQS